MPLRTLAYDAAQDNLRRSPLSRWPDGRRDGARLDGFVSVDVRPSFVLAAGEPVFTIGSCFARNIERRFAELGFEVVTQSLSFEDTGSKEDSFLNTYNPYSMLNEIRWALDPEASFPAEGLVEIEPGQWHDLHLFSGLAPASRQRVAERRAAVTDLYRRLPQCRVVVLTLGLAEAWFDTVTGLYTNGAPPGPVARLDLDRFELHVLSVSEIRACLEAMHALLTRHGHPQLQLMLSVSPVPFRATLTGDDAIAANTYSKSALRAAAEEFVVAHSNVDYVPSYEIVTLTDRTSAFINDNIHVASELVAQIIDAVAARYAPAAAEPTPITATEAKAHAAKARQCIAARDWVKAAKSLHALVPGDAWRLAGLEEFEFRFLYGRAIADSGRPVVGELQLKRAVELSPQSAPAIYQLGVIRRALGRTVEAERHLRQAVELDPDRVSYRLLLARHLVDMDRHSEAERQLNTLLATAPHNRAALDLRACCRDAIAGSGLSAD